MGKMTIPAPPKQYGASYGNLAGVDFSSDHRNVSPQRASMSRNMYKAYSDGYTEFVETRPGLQLLNSLAGCIYGIYKLAAASTHYVVHAGAHLYALATLSGTATQIYTGMAERVSSGAVYDGKLYIIDGEHYLVYDGSSCVPVTGTVPMTSIGRVPAGGGTVYQQVNMLTTMRKNSFRADGTATKYYLDAPTLTSDDVTATVDGAAVTAFTVDRSAGKVTFTTAPAAAAGGDDNVIIQFGVAVTDNLSVCRQLLAFDNRLFFAGNPNYPHVLWHSELNDPCYISDANYYKDGDSNTPITGLVVQDGLLLVLKASDSGALFVHTPSTDYDLGRVYPADESVIQVGCLGCAVAFRDDVVYLSRQGLEGITYPSYTKTERVVRHRSTLVDRKLAAEELTEATAEEWRGYLCILCPGGVMYLADSRETYKSSGAFEYEWFYWDGLKIGTAECCFLRQLDGTLYAGTTDGHICSFTGTDDNGTEIYSEWITRAETGGALAMTKTVKEKGAVVQCKVIPNSTFTVAASTDADAWDDVTTIRTGGLSFTDLNFAAMSFSSDDDNIIRLPINRKKWKWLKLRLSSSVRFGFAAVEYLYTVGNYIK